MAGKKRRGEIWIETVGGVRDFKISPEWGGASMASKNKFTKKEMRRIFVAVKNALETEFPGIVVNPWSDCRSGTPDFK